MDISCRGTLDLFNCTKKYRRFDAFLITSLICSFHVRLLDIVRPSSFALVTLSSPLPSTTIGANWGSFFTKDILSSLHFSLLRLISDRKESSRMIIYLNIAVTSFTFNQNVGFLEQVNNLLAILSFCTICKSSINIFCLRTAGPRF